MSEPIDLSKLGQPAEKAPSEPLEVTTAFVVAQGPSGEWTVLLDVTQPLSCERVASPDDLYAGAAIVQKDILAQEAALSTHRLMSQMAAAMQQQMQGQQIAQQLGNLRG